MAYCITCEKEFHPLGIMSHRAMHKRRKQNCTIATSDGTWEYIYGTYQ